MTARRPAIPRADVTELLAAIRDALDYPLAATTRSDEQGREVLADTRSSSVRCVLTVLLDEAVTDDAVRWAADTIRRDTARHPATYTPRTPATGGDHTPGSSP